MPDPIQVPEEAVEKLARKDFEEFVAGAEMRLVHGEDTWERLSQPERDEFLDRARTVLTDIYADLREKWEAEQIADRNRWTDRITELEARAEEAKADYRSLTTELTHLVGPLMANRPGITLNDQYIERVAAALDRAEKAEQALADLRERAIEKRLAEIHDACQEVAHEVEDPIQAVNEIEALAREALAAYAALDSTMKGGGDG